MVNQVMTIGRLAAAADVHVETVRYYQRRGLLEQPERPMGRVRHYGPSDVARLRFIRRAQATGFSLEEIAELLVVREQGSCDHARALTERKLAQVRQRLRELRQLERELIRLVEDCRHTSANESCPALDRLGG